MSLSSICFLHAVDIFLGHPIHRPANVKIVPETDVADLIENAPRIAFDRVIDEAIERKVDFVLLGGNTFVATEQSLCTQLDMLSGFDRLAEYGIRVFVAPGKSDPPEAWRAISDLPDNVTVFFDQDSEPVAVLREGKVVATVTCRSTVPLEPLMEVGSSFAFRSEISLRGPFSILMMSEMPGSENKSVPDHPSVTSTETSRVVMENSSRSLVESTFDYVALCSGSIRRTITLKSGMAHYPGPLQGTNPRQTGITGCTLVEVDDEGATQCMFVPMAAVAWEQENLTITPESNETLVREQMQSGLDRIGELPHGTVGIMQWNVQGQGAFWSILSDDSKRKQFIERFMERTDADSNSSWLHDFRLLTDTSTARLLAGEDSLAKEYLNSLETSLKYPNELLSRCVDESTAGDSELAKQLRTLIPHLDQDLIFATARRLGISWFCSAQGGCDTL